MTDEWFDIPQWSDCYEINKHGQIRTKARRYSVPYLGHERYRTTPIRLLKPRVNGAGYHIVDFSRAKVSTTYYIHDLMAMTFLGERPPGQVVRHLDDIGTHNWLTNLAYGTRSENELDKARNALERHVPEGIELEILVAAGMW